MKHEERKEYAVKLLKDLDIYKPYIDGFKKADKVCFFEGFAGFWVEEEPEVFEKMKEIEAEYGCTVYAITHEYTDFGECYDFLLVSKYKNEWGRSVVKEDDCYYAFAYVWNRTYDEFSEFGVIGLRSFGGGITRVS